ncbi:MAG: hypothetical protein HC841_08955 [Verrucomicrobiae bacterium]|nr:hypothetical protein [Verrucomicrobiae bacterium]
MQWFSEGASHWGFYEAGSGWDAEPVIGVGQGFRLYRSAAADWRQYLPPSGAPVPVLTPLLSSLAYNEGTNIAFGLSLDHPCWTGGWQFYVNEALYSTGTLPTLPVWSSAPNGYHSLYAVAVDAMGRSLTSAVLKLTGSPFLHITRTVDGWNLDFEANPNAVYQIQGTTNFFDWYDIGVYSNRNGVILHNHPQVFGRNLEHFRLKIWKPSSLP